MSFTRDAGVKAAMMEADDLKVVAASCWRATARFRAGADMPVVGQHVGSDYDRRICERDSSYEDDVGWSSWQRRCGW